MSTPPLSPSPVPSERKIGRVWPIAVTVLAGIALGLGSCFGFLSTMNINGQGRPINGVFAIGFIVGVLAVVVGSIWALVRFVFFFFRNGKDKQ